MTPQENYIMALTLLGEAENQTHSARLAVGHTILNRVKADLHNDGKPDWWGEGIIGVCLAPGQYSCWNRTDPNFKRILSIDRNDMRVLTACRDAIDVQNDQNYSIDPTDGATHYYHASLKGTPREPYWAKSGTYIKTIGDHVFYKDVK